MNLFLFLLVPHCLCICFMIYALRDNNTVNKVLADDDLYIQNCGRSEKMRLHKFLTGNPELNVETNKLRKQIANNERYIRKLQAQINQLQKK